LIADELERHPNDSTGGYAPSKRCSFGRDLRGAFPAG
jgi:hypothetical protein